MHCHNATEMPVLNEAGSITLVGHPNVGKSAIFQRLTGQRVTVSNYPGTTVDVTRGTARVMPDEVLVDTPGVIALPPHSDDELVTARVLMEEPIKVILQVGDAKNLRRTLLLSVQLAEMGHPMVLALNMMDEAQARGVRVDHNNLMDCLDLPVIPTTAVRGLGMEDLTAALQSAHPARFHIQYPAEIEHAVSWVAAIFVQQAVQNKLVLPVTSRSLALMWLGEDAVAEEWLRERLEDEVYAELESRRAALGQENVESPSVRIQQARLDFVEHLTADVILESGANEKTISYRLGHLATHPLWGWFLLGGVLYALYWFVGVFGAGTLVGLLEKSLFGEVINPWVQTLVTRLVPIEWLADFLVGEYGLWTLGITYALALILPIVSTFFLAFGVLEDSGYLPRLAALSNRLFQALGLNGKAVLPMVLGLGCVTMATLTTRVLESKRERFLVTLLLALAVPCSAQLGVVMGMLASISFTATLIWGSVVTLVMLAVGWLAARLVPGERTQLLVELPPMRWPQWSNVLLKTLARLEWYLKEVVPLFLLGAALMFLLDRTGILAWLIDITHPLVTHWLGLPGEASAAFLMGFVRRDFGATGLFVMQSQNLLTAAQVVVSMVTITLFVPCIASVMMIAKERGWRSAAGMLVLIFPLAFLVGGLLNRILSFVGWGV